MANAFDRFDSPEDASLPAGNPFDAFDAPQGQALPLGLRESDRPQPINDETVTRQKPEPYLQRRQGAQLQEPAPESGSVLQDAAGLWGIGTGSLVEGVGWLFNSDEITRLGASTKDYWQKTLSDEQVAANKKKFVNDDWSMGEGATDIRTYFGLGVQSLPMMVPGMGAAGATAKAAVALGASKKLASGLAAGAASAGEGVTIGAMVGQEVDQAIRSMPEADKMQSPYYSDLRKMYGEEEATDRLSKMAANPAALKSGTVGAALGFAFNKFLGDALTGRLSGGPVKEGLKGGLIEGGTETLQSGAESDSTQRALEKYAGQEYSYTELVNQMVTGLAAGSTMGGSIGVAGGLSGRSGPQPEGDGEAAPPVIQDQVPNEQPAPTDDNAPTNDGLGRPDWATDQTNIFRDGPQPETAVASNPFDAFDNAAPVEPQAKAKPGPEVPTAEPKTELTEAGTGVFRVPVDQIKVDPDQYQFRSRVNDKGVDKRLDEVKQWDDKRAGSVLLHRKKDGSLNVADGHHRVDLARRLGQTELNATIVDEADGISVEGARVEAAMNNIADGKAEPIDVAKVFRDSKVPTADVRDTFNLPGSQVVRDGESLSKLSDNVFGMVTASQLTEKDGAAIGSAFTEQAQQEAAVGVFQKVEPQTDYQRQLLINEVRAADFAQAQGDQGGLFGDDAQEISLMQDRLKVLDTLRQQLNSDKRLFKSLNDNADRATGAGNQIATEANATITQSSAKSLDLIGRVTTAPALNDMVNRAARRVFDGESRTTVAKELKQELSSYEAGRNAESGGQPGNAQGVRANAEPGQEPGAGESVPGQDTAGADQGGQSEEVAPPLDLHAQTEAELAKQAAVKAGADKAEAQAKRDAEQKEKADAEADDFVLSGSDRTADVAESRGQESLLDQPTEPESKIDQETRADQKPMFSRAGERNLFVAHNLSEKNLQHVLEIGGLAAPSLAVGRTDKGGFGDFGEITLLAPSSILESDKARTFDADIYTPRHQQAEYKIDRGAFLEQSRGIDNEFDLALPQMDDVERKGMSGMARSPAYQYAWLKSKGKAPKARQQKVDPAIKKLAKLGLSRYELANNPKAIKIAEAHYREQYEAFVEVVGREDARREGLYFEEDGSLKLSLAQDLMIRAERYKDSGGVDIGQMKQDLNKKMRPKLVQRQYEKWIQEQFNEINQGPRLFSGFTYSGSRRYKPYNLETVVKEMTRELQGGEGFNYASAGSVRASFATEMKRVKQVQANRDRIVSTEAMEQAKEESAAKLEQALEALKPYYKFDADGWGYTSDASSAIAEGIKGQREAFNLDTQSRSIIKELTDYLRELPTDYFETKIGRAVDLSEFSVALVPKGTPMETVKALRDKGLKVKQYDATDPDARREAVAKQEDLLFTREGYRRTPGQATQSLTVEQATAIRDELTKNWKGAPPITIADSISEFPKGLRSAIREAQAEGDMRAVFWDNQVYVLAPRIPNRAAMEEVILHEVIGHYGLRKMVGGELKPLLNQVWLAMGGKSRAKDIIKRYFPAGNFDANNPVHRMTVAEELIAHMAESGKHRKLLARVMTAIRDGLRRLGFTLDLNEADILGLLRGAQKTVERGGISRPSSADLYSPANSEQGAAAMSRANQISTDAFAEWFGDSKVVDEQGVPLVVYHGTGSDFSEFDPATFGKTYEIEDDQGFFFASDPEEASYIAQNDSKGDAPIVMPVYLKLENPLEIDYTMVRWRSYQSDDMKTSVNTLDGNKDELMYDAREGDHDGIIVTGIAGDKTYVVFDAVHIKSATGNSGTFDPSNPDIRFSHAAPPDLDPQPFGPPSNTKVLRLVSRLADKHTVLKGIQKNIADQFGEIDERSDAYRTEERMHGKIEEDLRLIEENMVDPLAAKMNEYNITMKQLDKFAYALHAPERNKVIAERDPGLPDGGSGMTNAAAAEIINRVDQSGKMPQYLDVAKKIHKMLEMRRKILKNSGLLDEETVGAWEASYKFYVPLKGFAADEAQAAMPKAGRGFSISGKESRMAAGRRSRAASPLANTISDLTEAVLRRRKNEVGNAFMNLVLDYPNDSYWRIFTDENPEVERKVVSVKDPVTGKKVWRTKETAIPPSIARGRYFTTKVDGKTYYIKIGTDQDQRLMNAMSNVGVEDNNLIVKVLGPVTRAMSSLNTAYSPEFAVTNFVRDLQTALLNLTSEQSADDGLVRGKNIVAKTLKDTAIAVRAINASLKGSTREGKVGEWQAHFDRFRADGAKTGYFDMKDLDGQIKDLEKKIGTASGGAWNTTRQAASAIAKWVDSTNSAVENGVRLSAYVNAIEAGASRNKASSLAKNMTVNFNRRGSQGATMNALFMFANAAVQGNANFIRTMGRLNGKRGDKMWGRLNKAQKLGAMMAIGGFFNSMLQRMVAGDDEDGVNWWDKVPDYVKERNIVIMKSLYGGEPGTFHTIPLPYGYNIFPVIGFSMDDLINSDKSVGEISGNVVLAALGSFSPIGFEDSESVEGAVAKNMMPTALKPLITIPLNENFMGGRFYKENLPFGTPKPDSSLSYRGTPEMYKKLSKGLNEVTSGSEYRSGGADFSPDIMEYLVGYFGGAAYTFYTSRIPNMVTKAVQRVELEDREIAFWRKLNGKVLPYEDRSKFYDRRNEVNQIINERDNLRGRERSEFVREYRDKIRLKPMIDATGKRLKVLRGRRDRTEAMDLSATEKDERLQRIERQMKRFYDRFNKRYNELD